MRVTSEHKGRSARDAGFSVVEVIIAVLVLSAVVSAIALAAVGGTHLQGSARAQAAMTNVGKRVLEHLRTDREWMETSACRSGDCSIAAYVDSDMLHEDSVDGEFELVSAVSTPTDSDADGRADDDRDGIVPDFFRVEVTLRPSADVKARFGMTKQRSIMITIDHRGNVQKGSLTVEVCRVLNQADERMQVQGCPERAIAGIRMNGCPAPERVGCSSAFSWVSSRGQHASAPSPFVVLQRVPYAQVPRFQLVSVLDSSDRWSSDEAKHVEGTYVFQNIPTGNYRIQGLPARLDGLSERWALKESPSFHGHASAAVESSVSVDAGVRSRALVLFRPKRTSTGLNLYFQRRTHTYPITGPHTHREVAIPKSQEEPTDTYVGVQAQYLCSRIRSSSGRNITVDIEGHLRTSSEYVTSPSCRTDRAGQNCVQIWAKFGTAVDIPPFTILFFSFGGEIGHVVEPQTDHYLGILCSYYAEFYQHTYYKSGRRTSQMRPGAAEAVTYWMEPKPDFRHMEFGGDGTPQLSIGQCKTVRRAQCGSVAGAPNLSQSLVPGLNSSLLAKSDDSAHVGLNQGTDGSFGRGPLPAPTYGIRNSGGTWVYPSGVVVSPTGASIPVGARITFTGEGECYWIGPRTNGPIEAGDCDPCKPIWKPGTVLLGCGAILERFKWWREAWETVLVDDPFVEGFDRTEEEYPLSSPPPVTKVLDPPWMCSTVVPIIFPGRATCSERVFESDDSPASVNIGSTTHTSSSSGGVATVGARNMNTG